MEFAKYHALGNSYIVVSATDFPEPVDTNLIQRLCSQEFGIGSDGVLLDCSTTLDAHPRLRIFNPDGSEAEKSGNGIRIFCRYLWDQHRVGDELFLLDTSGGQVQAKVLDGGKQIQVGMGQISFNARDIPVAGCTGEVLLQSILVNGQTLIYSAATIGNPHCIIFTDSPTEQMARELGPLLETHPTFPNRTNVQLVKVLNSGEIQVEIWERGAGYTLASGSSSCAASAVAHKLGYCDPDILVHLAGGDIRINIAPDYHITMTGPVTPVASGSVVHEWQKSQSTSNNR
jgi:diaminopimelate epimerase